MLSLDSAVRAHGEFREHIADTVHGTHEHRLDAALATVLLRSFNYCFNTYKAIGLLLPERYYENGNALLRLAWEVSLNLAWVCALPSERARAFIQFTVVETYRIYKSRVRECEALKDKAQADAVRHLLHEFERTYASILKEYQKATGKQRGRLAQRFSLGNLEQVASELGLPWSAEYRGIYPLLCSYAHGSPGVALFPKPFVVDSAELQPEAMAATENPRTVKLALWSMAILERSYRALIDTLNIDDAAYLDDLNLRVGFRESLRTGLE